MKTYASVLKKTLSMSQQQAIEYRVDYLMRVLRALLDVLVLVTVVVSFYGYTESIMGWNKWEAMVVFGMYQLISSLVFVFCGYGIDELPNNIIHGRLDQFLVKPLDSQFLTSIKVAFMTNLFRSFFGLLVIIYALGQMSYSPSLEQVALGMLAIVSGLIIYYCISFSISAIAFWTSSTEQGSIWYTTANMARFPADFYQRDIQWILYVLPILFIATVPAEALLGKNFRLALFSPVVAILTFGICRYIWKRGLRDYQSASS